MSDETLGSGSLDLSGETFGSSFLNFTFKNFYHHEVLSLSIGGVIGSVVLDDSGDTIDVVLETGDSGLIVPVFGTVGVVLSLESLMSSLSEWLGKEPDIIEGTIGVTVGLWSLGNSLDRVVTTKLAACTVFGFKIGLLGIGFLDEWRLERVLIAAGVERPED